MGDDTAFRTIWRRFRRGGDLRPGVCLTASLAAALLLGGAGIGGGWLVGMLRPSGSRSIIVGNVEQRDVLTGLAVAAAVWGLSLVWLWRPAVRFRRPLSPNERRSWTTPLIGMTAVVAIVVVGSYVIGRKPWDDRQLAVTALSLAGAGIVAALWLPAVFVHEQGRPVIGSAGEVLVRCPQCGHSMVGLRAATCPECGESYTLDGLIRQQDYERRVG